MSTLSVANIQSNSASTPPAIRDSGGTEIGTFCRAWVNWNGTGTVAIRASFNVTSITDNGVGDYTVNFTNAMPDANYAPSITIRWDTGGGNNTVIGNIANVSGATATGSLRVKSQASQTTSTPLDCEVVSVAIFR